MIRCAPRVALKDEAGFEPHRSAQPAPRVTRFVIVVLQALHYAILVWGLLGWLVPSSPWLIAYLVAMPAIAAQWLLNRNTCILNNVESWVASGRWRNPQNTDEGGFIAGVIARVFGRRPTARETDAISYGLLALFWVFALIHLQWIAA